MPSFLITYDFKEKKNGQYKKFLEYAADHKLSYVKEATDGALLRLTNTTIWGGFPSADDARIAFDLAKEMAEKNLDEKIILEKRVIVGITATSMRSDKKKAPEKQWTRKTANETCIAHQQNDPFFAY